MKHSIKRFAVTVILVSITCGCNDLSFEYGNDIKFNASTGRLTRADYSGDIVGSVERIDWESGDKIRIACNQVSEPSSKYADYLLESISSDGRYSSAKIGVSTEDNAVGLRWGIGDHNFYAVYPSPLMSGVTRSLDNNIASGEIPASQSVESYSGTAAAKVAKPDFDASMMMVSSKTVNVKSNSRDVSLDFIPVTTAIQFTITNKTGEALSTCKVELSSNSHPLSGPFTCDIATGESTFTGTLSGCKTVNITFAEPIVTPIDGTLTFTFFLNPADDLDDLSLLVYEQPNKNRFTELKKADKSPVVFSSGVKAIVSGIFVPAGAVWKVAQKSNVYTWTDGTAKDVGLE